MPRSSETVAALASALAKAQAELINPEKSLTATIRTGRPGAYACAKSGARLLTLSSTSVYGVQQKIVSEDCSIDELKPQSPYAEIKLREEGLVSSLVAKEGLR